jgi:hypothetical protein
MKYEQAKPLLDDLVNIAVLYHASSMLRTKIYEALDEFLPTLDAGCLERGCPCYDERDNLRKPEKLEDYEYQGRFPDEKDNLLNGG